MVKVFRAAVLVALLFGTTSAFAATTHYISNSLGSDKNDGLTKTTAWAHLPGMQGTNGCSANCASYTPQPGDKFVLYGGDTWNATNLGVYFPSNWSGSSANCVLPYGTGATSSCIYIGVDTTWYNSSVCGSSFCRPIFDCGGTVCSGETDGNSNPNFFSMYGNYIVIDNIEMKGLYDANGGENFVYVNSDHVEVMNSYFHGWSHASGVGNNSAVFSCSQGSCVGADFIGNVVDGSDTTKDMMNGVRSGADIVGNNYFRYVVAAVLAACNIVYGNTVEYPVLSFAGDHANGIFNFDQLNGETVLMYNNVVRHTTNCSGCVNFWINGNGGPDSNFVGYVFNNVEYDLNASNVLDIAAHPSGDYGTYYVFNNTIQCGNDSSYGACSGNQVIGPYYSVTETNNHWITTGSSITWDCGGAEPGGTCNYGKDLIQTLSQAKSQGYVETDPVFRPASGCTPSTCGTVGNGTNEQSFCTTLSQINAAAGKACQSDTTYGVGYNASTHSVIVPARPTNSRPSSSGGNWDIGAYQFSSTQAQAPQPPTGLQASVN